jgi:hypothetical protein
MIHLQIIQLHMDYLYVLYVCVLYYMGLLGLYLLKKTIISTVDNNI